MAQLTGSILYPSTVTGSILLKLIPVDDYGYMHALSASIYTISGSYDISLPDDKYAFFYLNKFNDLIYLGKSKVSGSGDIQKFV